MFHRVGFFLLCGGAARLQPSDMNSMDQFKATMAQRIASRAGAVDDYAEKSGGRGAITRPAGQAHTGVFGLRAQD
jgi:hypothetical protein